MASTTQKWLIGCGAGCLVILLAVVGLGIGGALFVRDIVLDVKETEAARHALARRHGSPYDFCPDPDGGVRPERMEAFLRAREIMAPARTELEKTLSLLSDEGGKRRIISKIGAGVGLISQIIEFDSHRSETLLEAGMGLGEYEYLYAMAYYCWLGKSPADGPPFTLVGDHDDEEESRDEFDAREDRREMILSRLNALHFAQLGNQLAALPPAEPGAAAEGGAEPGVAAEGGEAWRAQLKAELAALEREPYRLAWIEGLPSALEDSFRPYRARLEESYCALCNPSEMGLGREGGP